MAAFCQSVMSRCSALLACATPLSSQPTRMIRSYPMKVKIDKLPKIRRPIMKLYRNMGEWRKKNSQNVWFREGEFVHEHKVFVTQHIPRILPGLNVYMNDHRNLRSYEAGEVVYTMEKTKLNFAEHLVQSHFSHLQGDDSNMYRPYAHVIPNRQTTKFKLVDAL